MRKLKWEEAMLFVVPLAIVPLAMLLTRLKPSQVPPPQPRPTMQREPSEARAVPSATPEPTWTEPPPAPRLPPEQSLIVASRDGRTLYTFGGITGIQGDTHIWDARTRVHKRSFTRMTGPGYPEMWLSPDSSTMYYVSNHKGTSNSSIGVLLDVHSGQQHQFTAQPGQDLLHVGLSRHTLASIVGGSIELRSLRDGHVTGHIPVDDVGGRGHRPEMLCSSPDGSLLAWVANHKSDPSTKDTNWSSTRSDAIAVYSTSRKRRIFSRTLPDYNVREVAISGDNTKLIVMAHYNPNAPRFFALSWDRKLIVFDLPSGRLRHRLSLGEGTKALLQPSSDGKWLALQGGDVRSRFVTADWVQIVNLASGQSTAFPEEHNWFGTAFSADSRELFVFASKHRIQLKPGARWQKVPF